MKQYKLLICIFILIVLSSCRYHCPDFPESELKYIPYKLNDTLRYSSNNDTIELIVSDYYKTDKHTVKANLPIMDLECEERANYITNKNQKIGCYIKESYDSQDLFNVEFDTYDVFNFSLYDDTIHMNGIIKKEFKENQKINGKIYYNCITLEKKFQENLIWKIVKVDSFGIVEFYHRDYQEPWTIIN